LPWCSIGGALTTPEASLQALNLNHGQVLRAAGASLREVSSLFFLSFLERKDLLRELALGGVGLTTKIPYAQFGPLITVDRHEIEALRAIAQMIDTYSTSGVKDSTPFSLAVFGAPGSGKSFGIKALTTAQRPDTFTSLEFNMSQFDSADDIVGALHRTRDVGLSGKIPVVFWDEFDTTWRGAELGWLRYFLSPME